MFAALASTTNIFQSKVIRLRRWLEELPDRYSHVLYLNGIDTFFLRNLTACCEALNRCGKPILMGMEGHCFPLMRVSKWMERFPAHPSNRRWPNAGVFMGRRNALTESLAVLAEPVEAGQYPLLPGTGGRSAPVALCLA